MLIDARWRQHLIATLQLEPLFKSQHFDGAAGGGRHRLLSLLDGLGLGSDVANASLKRNAAVTARAATIIAEWISYLPEDCVRAMVADGWHWST
ncbi:MAG: hypothetical protein ABSD02_07985 [Steroidobacteraceae bacterium]